MAEKVSLGERIGRVMDVLVAGLGLAVLSPLMLLIAAAIVLEIGRPVFYVQTRLGRGGEPFRIYKFRKFRVSNDAPGPLLTVRNDARMSRVGGLLERTKLDELPQFYNVLRGDMAMVGPRPDNGVAQDYLTSEYRALLDHRPGIFGPGQTAFRNAGALYPEGVHPHDFYRASILPVKAALDLAYYPRRTPLKDLVWIIRGVLAVVGLHPTVRELPAAASDARRQPVARRTGALARASAAVTAELAAPEPAASETPAG